uniref:C2H2-type domain-containing protein n=1 Tax=Timema poppense TaxID=170557 RepID=A0A7R9CUW0_TIMPO|nr:unnamed protein product [Timema poppensis]
MPFGDLRSCAKSIGCWVGGSLDDNYIIACSLPKPHPKLQSQFVCQHCGRSYKQCSSLNRHLRYECGAGKKRDQKCLICGKRYFRPDTLQEHYQMSHAKFKYVLEGRTGHLMSGFDSELKDWNSTTTDYIGERFST